MLFKETIRFKHGNLVRGDKCLWKSLEAEYLGSFKSEGKGKWRHLFNVRVSWCDDEVVMVEDNLDAITTSKRKEPELEGQMMLI